MDRNYMNKLNDYNSPDFFESQQKHWEKLMLKVHGNNWKDRFCKVEKRVKNKKIGKKKKFDYNFDRINSEYQEEY